MNRMKKTVTLLSLFIIVLFPTLLFAQNEAHSKVMGTVIDVETRKVVDDFPFKVLPYDRTIKTDKNGAFLLNLPSGKKIQLVFDDYPYYKRTISLEVNNDTSITIYLAAPKGITRLQEVEVIAGKPVNDKPMSVERLDKVQFLTTPAMMGERDVVKMLAMTSGVSSSSEGSADMQVRGGEQGQNLFLLNGVPLYFTEHAFGLTSAYNPSIVQSAQFYKSAFPVWYGGKISSILDVRTIVPSLTKSNGEVEVGLLMTKAMWNKPLIKNKLGMYVSGRIFNLTPLMAVLDLQPESEYQEHFRIAFADFNAGLKYRLNDRNDFRLDVFRIGDNWVDKSISNGTYETDTYSFGKNDVQYNSSLTWHHQMNEKTGNELNAYYDHYQSSLNDLSQYEYASDHSTIFNEYRYKTGVSTFHLSDVLSWQLKPSIDFLSGMELNEYCMMPTRYEKRQDSVTVITEHKNQWFTETDLFTQSDFQLTKNQKFSIGLHMSLFGHNKVFASFEPRLSYLIQLPKHYSFSVSVNKMSQAIHNVVNFGIGVPFQLYIGSNANFQPETSWQYDLGMGKEIKAADFNMSFKVDAWYKTMNHILAFYDNYNAYVFFEQNGDVYGDNQQYLAVGNRVAKGVDLSSYFNFSKTSVTANYTLMSAVDQFNDLNDGLPFASPTDIRHTFSIFASYQLTSRLVLSADWQYHSGRPITIPVKVMPNPSYDYDANTFYMNHPNEYSHNYEYLFLYGQRSNYYTKAFHKLDISLTKNYLIKRKYKSSFTFGLYNAYNRANAYTYKINIVKQTDGTYKPVLQSISIFPILPSFSWRMEF